MKIAVAGVSRLASRLICALFFLFLGTLFLQNADCALAADFDGTYSGHFNGPLAGFWIAVFDQKGFGRFVSWSEADQTVDYGIGNVTSEGVVTIQSYLGMSIKADVQSSGEVSGTWSLNGISGAIDGNRQPGASLELLAGAYNGTYEGADSGTWQISVGQNGLISGRFINDATNTAYDVQSGAVNAEGKFAMRVADGTSVTGDLDDSGTAAGAWFKGVVSGDVNGSKMVQATGSGSGGCFITDAMTANPDMRNHLDSTSLRRHQKINLEQHR